jgi:hypothetical protein
VWEWCARERDDCACGSGREERRDDASSEREEEKRCAGEDEVLPRLGERSLEWDRGAEDGADRGGAGTVEKSRCVVVGAEAVEAGGAEQT